MSTKAELTKEKKVLERHVRHIKGVLKMVEKDIKNLQADISKSERLIGLAKRHPNSLPKIEIEFAKRTLPQDKAALTSARRSKASLSKDLVEANTDLSNVEARIKKL